MTTFVDRLNSLVAEHKSANAFAKLVGISQSSLRQYLAGSTPGLDKVVQIAEATGVSINWLATGQGPRDSSTEPLHVAKRTQREQTAMMHVPSTDLVDQGALVMLPRLDIQPSAGSGALIEQEKLRDFVGFSERWLREHHINPAAAHLLTAKGDSMEPTIRDGDTLIVDTSITMAVDSAIYVVVYAGLLLVKRLVLLRDGAVVLSSDNKAVYTRDEEIPAPEIDQLHIAGRVMWFGRSM